MSIKARDLDESKGEYLEATMRSPVKQSPVITFCTEKNRYQGSSDGRIQPILCKDKKIDGFWGQYFTNLSQIPLILKQHFIHNPTCDDIQDM